VLILPILIESDDGVTKLSWPTDDVKTTCSATVINGPNPNTFIASVKNGKPTPCIGVYVNLRDVAEFCSLNSNKYKYQYK